MSTIAFVCVENAGRSQMAAAYAERAIAVRGLEGRVAVVSGGTEPAEAVHPVVVDAMAEVGFDLSQRRPRPITPAQLLGCDVVVTMGCSATDVCPAAWRGDVRDWALADPGGRPIEVVRAIRDDIAARVDALLDGVRERPVA